MYAQIKTALFQIIPGFNEVNYIFFGVLVWIIGVYAIKTRWGAFFLTLVAALVMKGLDFSLLNEVGSNTIQEFAYIMGLPLILTLIQRRIASIN